MREAPICTACWNTRHPSEPVNTGGPVHGNVEECHVCGGLTSVGLTDEVRDDD